jgi:hypothetical protein
VQGEKIIKGLLLTLLLLCAASTALAQGGGKAEPSRIEFKRGLKSATVKDRIRNDTQAEYIFAAREGQRIRIRVTSAPARSARFKLLGADGADYKLNHNGYTWSGVAPETGDHLIYVMRSTERPGSSTYSLTLTIE